MGGSDGRLPGACRARARAGRRAWVGLLLGIAALCGARAQAPCEPALAHVVSVQGKVELRRGSAPWVGVARDTPLCRGDTLRVLRYGRAALRLSNDTLLRLDQGTTLTLAPAGGGAATLIEQLTGGLHVITRTPRAFNIRTPLVNANVEGTEFAIRLTPGAATVAVYEGVVLSNNASGSARLASGEQVTTDGSAGALVRSIAVRPLDAVAWTLYFPAVFDFRSIPARDSADAATRQSVALYRDGRISEALDVLGAVEADRAGSALLTYRAGLLLLVGRLAQAREDIAVVLVRDPADSDAHALLAVVAVVENEKQRAIELATLAVAEDPRSAAALIALSYAQQASFQLGAALASADRAAEADPASALAQARRAELALSLGRLDAALAAAREAVRLDPGLARTQTVLGFANLTRLEIGAARAAFERAIGLDQSDPLPRLGLGLAIIRSGDLEAGRAEIEIAAILDPGDSLVRSYLGKAYYEEKRDAAAARQFGLAIALDPRDPTPYFYRAVMEQAENRPVPAVQDLERSLVLNDNRAVYRSRLFLDQDLAARSVRQAYIYRDLGFQQVAALEAVKSLALDPTDPAAHRFLADAYVGGLRTEGARVSELLQSQLRQPLGMNALQPQLFRGQQFFVEGIGPARAGGYEYAPLFTRNGVAVRLDAIGGSGGTFGDQFVLSGLQDTFAFSLGQYHFETDGLRANNDFSRDVFSAFAQVALSPSVRLQAELRDDFGAQGDISLRFDGSDFRRTFRADTRLSTARLGGYFAIDPSADIVVSAVGGSGRAQQYLTDTREWFVDNRQRLRSIEAQFARRTPTVQVLGGLSYYLNKVSLEQADGTLDLDTRETSAYLMLTFTGLPWGLVPQFGLNYDTYDQANREIAAFDPKLGLIWSLPTGTTLRAAAFRTIKRNFVADQTLQPTQIAGFNQFFDDVNGTRSSRAGLGIDQKFGAGTFLGAEVSGRNLQIPGYPGEPDFEWSERGARIYAYQIVNDRVTLTAEWLRERQQRPEDFTLDEGFTNLDTTFVPLGLRLSSIGNWAGGVTVTAVRQQLRYEDRDYVLRDGSSSFTVVDASVSYRLPGRVGMLTAEVRNLFDRRFNYQELDFYASPRVYPGRLFFARLTIAL